MPRLRGQQPLADIPAGDDQMTLYTISCPCTGTICNVPADVLANHIGHRVTVLDCRPVPGDDDHD